MSEFVNKIEEHTQKALSVLRRWDEEEKASKVMRRFLSEEKEGKTNLDKLLNERMRIALEAEDDKVRLQAIDSSLNMAAGVEKAATQVNTQINFGDFLNSLK